MNNEKSTVIAKEQGYLTVEATLVLTSFLFFVLFIMNMGQIYRAQNYVMHGLLQTGKALAFGSYSYTNALPAEAGIRQIRDWMGVADDKTRIQVLWKNGKYQEGNYREAVQTAFGYCIAGTPGRADEELKRMGLKDGIASIDFGETKKAGSDLEITAVYDVQLPFAFFGHDRVTLHSRVVCGVWE